MEGATIRPMTPGILLVPRPSHAVFFSTSRSQRGLLWPSNSTPYPSHSLSPRLFPFLHIFHHEHNHRYGCRRKRKFLTLADKAPIGRSTCRPFWNHLRYSRPLPLYRKQSGLPSFLTLQSCFLNPLYFHLWAFALVVPLARYAFSSAGFLSIKGSH